MVYYQPYQQIPGLGEGLSSIGGALAAWGERGRRQEEEKTLEDLWKNILAEPTPSTQPGAAPTPDTFAGVRKLFKGADPKTLARVMGSQAFTPQGLKALASIGASGAGGGALIAGESLQGAFPNANLKGYIFKQNEQGDWSTLVSPQRAYSLSPGQYLLEPGTNKVLAQAPERLQVAQLSQGGQLRLVDPNSGNSYVLAERAPAPTNAGNTPNVVLQIPGWDPETNQPTVTFQEYQRGKNGAPGGPVGPPQIAGVKSGPSQLSPQQQKDLTAIDQQAATIGGALKDVQATPSAFGGTKAAATGMAKGIGALPGSMAEASLYTPEQIKARTGLFNQISAVIKERAGTAQTKQELDRINAFLPSQYDNPAQIVAKLQGFQDYLAEKRQGIVPYKQGTTTPRGPTSIDDLLKKYGPK